MSIESACDKPVCAGCEAERTDGAQAEDEGRQSDIPETETDGGTGIRDNQAATGFRPFLLWGLEKANLEWDW
jgi:hypothetical protein